MWPGREDRWLCQRRAARKPVELTKQQYEVRRWVVAVISNKKKTDGMDKMSGLCSHALLSIFRQIKLHSCAQGVTNIASWRSCETVVASAVQNILLKKQDYLCRLTSWFIKIMSDNSLIMFLPRTALRGIRLFVAENDERTA